VLLSASRLVHFRCGLERVLDHDGERGAVQSGAAAARGGNNYTVNVNGGVMTNAQTGKVVIDAVKSFNRASGPADIAVRPISGRY
jgi:hypothetical protein